MIDRILFLVAATAVAVFASTATTPPPSMALSRIRENFHDESEAGINAQINLELNVSYIYQSMAMYFDRDDVALPGFAKFFSDASLEEREHAERFMRYQNKRGGRIVLYDVVKPVREEWGTGLDAMKSAMDVEKNMYQALLNLHGIAKTHNDAQMMDFIESQFLWEQVHCIKKLSNYVTNLQRVGDDRLMEYQFDRHTLAWEGYRNMRH